MQDLGAAGLTSASVEAAAKGGAGIDLDVSRVPRRDSGMVPYEVMLSESQERMLVIARRGREEQVKAIFDKWDLECSVIGAVTADGIARVRDGDRVEGEVPVHLLTDPPLYRLQGRKPTWLDEAQRHDLASPAVAGRLARPRPCSACSPPPTSQASGGSTASTTTRCRPTPSRLPAPTPP